MYFGGYRRWVVEATLPADVTASGAEEVGKQQPHYPRRRVLAMRTPSGERRGDAGQAADPSACVRTVVHAVPVNDRVVEGCGVAAVDWGDLAGYRG